MRYVVGDIHSEINKLKKLISFILLTDKYPEFIFIGDYIDKGEDAKATLDFLLYLNENFKCEFLMGNHEYCWLNLNSRDSSIDFNNYLQKYGGIQTSKSFKANFAETKKILFDQYNTILGNLKAFYIADEFFISHSGVPVDSYSIDPINIFIKDFLFNRYEFIKNQAFSFNKYVTIFGHTGFYMPYVDDFKIGIDTGACYLEHQPLTAFCTDNGAFYDSNNKNYTLSSIKGNFCPNIIRNKPYRMYD